MERTESVERCIEVILERVGPELHVATPLGLGKPNHLLNALYRRVKRDPSLSLTLYTALTLEIPRASSELERRFLEPFVERVFGNYPDLDYERDRTLGSLPPNVRVLEFFMQPGKHLSTASAQRDHICTNYTYVARDLVERGINVVMQQMAVQADGSELKLSFSSNPDVSLDMLELLQGTSDVVAVCQTNGDLPFMPGDAEVAAEVFDVIVHDPAQDFRIFSMPKDEVPDADTLVGLYASTLIRDAGELQVGIGSLGDAVTHALCLRQRDNAAYRRALSELAIDTRASAAIERFGDLSPFERGLFAATEMLVDGYRHLWEAGILRRKVYDDAPLQRLLNEERIGEQVTPDTLRALLEIGAVEAHLSARDVAYLRRFGVFRQDVRLEGYELLRGDERAAADLGTEESFDAACALALGQTLRGGALAHAGFFIGPRSFYDWLRALPMEERRLIQMRSVRHTNLLHGDESVRRLQRQHGRFLNTGMMVTLSGAVVSDGLEDGRVVSGVGGQHDFVAMAHALPDGHSVILLRATRQSRGGVVSNIVPSYGHCTIPRHERDLVVTEYGVAVLRGKTDEEIARALIEVADSRFQPELVEVAKQRGKLAPDYEVPPAARNNLPESYLPALARLREEGLFPRYPFGTDFTDVELVLVDVLKQLKSDLASPRAALSALGSLRPPDTDSEALAPYLERMGLRNPSSLRDKLWQWLLASALQRDPRVR